MPTLRSLLSFVFAMGVAAMLAVIFLLTMDMVIHVPLPYAIAGSFLLVAMVMTGLLYLALRLTAKQAPFASPAFETADTDMGRPGAAPRPTATPRLLLLGVAGRQEHKAEDSGPSRPSSQQQRRTQTRRNPRVTVRSILLIDASQEQAREEVA